jgi:hypothetical protein
VWDDVDLRDSFKVCGFGVGEVRKLFCLYFGFGDGVSIFKKLDVNGAVKGLVVVADKEAVVFVVGCCLVQWVLGGLLGRLHCYSVGPESV